MIIKFDAICENFYCLEYFQCIVESMVLIDPLLNMNIMFLLLSGSEQVYYVYGFMLLVFLILIIVTVCVTIVGTYFLLNAENYHWQWTSFFSAASTAVYVYLYSIYYYYAKTKMSGFFQTSFYFGYTLMFCLGLGILCGKFLLLLLIFAIIQRLILKCQCLPIEISE